MELPTARTSTSGEPGRQCRHQIVLATDAPCISTTTRPCRIGFKPPATIAQEQSTVKYDGSEGVLAAKGRHDPCVLPRAVPIVETMAAIVLME